MRITFYGGVSEVGRSCMLIEDKSGKNIMLDCGVKLGEHTEYPLITNDEMRKVQNLFITHAHLDHCGYLPHVYAGNAKPRILATKPTHDLAGVLLSDYRRIQKDDKFKQKDVDDVLKDMELVEFNETKKAGFELNIFNAGHILGSSMVRINEHGGILYTGDICMRKTKVLEACEKNVHAHTLIVENTYGSKEDVLPNFKDSYQKMAASIREAIKEGGWVLIPSFAVGRAQEILLVLDDYMRSGAIPQVKIYMDGMIGKAMRIYRHNAYYANEDIKKRILMSEDDPFNSPMFFKPKSKTKDDVFEEPCIIVTTSGMLSGGPVLGYLERMAGNPKNRLIFVGYQAEGTRGSKLLAGAKTIQIGDKEIEVHMKVENLHISGHADYNEIMQFIKSVRGLKRVFLVHGEKTEMKEDLEKKFEVVTPRLLESHGI
ncbi:MAG: MBL fold metallo-hydrolase RNA specificity domain-containing protein [Candidatus Micrarchaeia archaeon]